MSLLKISEAIILAGGLGTRLRSAVPDLPKCMAPVNSKPFITYVIKYFKEQGIEKYILATGYMHEVIEVYFNSDSFINTNPSIKIQYSVEDTPLGTGGAIRLACNKTSEKNILVVNGDTLFKVQLDKLASFHLEKQGDCTIGLKPMTEFDRYGVVELNADNSVQSFKEKQYYLQGLINGGVYALNVDNFLKEDLPLKFSFEKEYLEKFYNIRKIFGKVEDGYFIDIGIPGDYLRAQRELD